MPEELEKVKAAIGGDRLAAGKFQLASEIFANLITDSKLQEFLTLVPSNYLD